MKEPFAEFLQELGHALGMELFVDVRGACSVRMQGHLHIQMQPGPERDELWMVAEIAELPPGRFREEVLREALKANHAFRDMPFSFSYVDAKNRLLLSTHSPFDKIDGTRAALLLSVLSDTAETWKRAVAGGRSSP